MLMPIHWLLGTGGPLIGRKNGSIFLTNRLMRTVNKIAVLWEELENLLNKPKPSYREIRPMRGLLVLCFQKGKWFVQNEKYVSMWVLAMANFEAFFH